MNLKADLDQFIFHYNPINHHYWKAYRENRITQEELRHNASWIPSIKLILRPPTVKSMRFQKRILLIYAPFHTYLKGPFPCLIS